VIPDSAGAVWKSSLHRSGHLVWFQPRWLLRWFRLVEAQGNGWELLSLLSVLKGGGSTTEFTQQHPATKLMLPKPVFTNIAALRLNTT
jgi:hypothetical protein